MKLHAKRNGELAAPLEILTLLEVPAGTLRVHDGRGREYHSSPCRGKVAFTVGGALGTHRAVVTGFDGVIVAELTFPVGAETRIDDEGGQFHELLQMLKLTMFQDRRDYVRYQGRIYSFFICWLRDHVHLLKGMKYFAADLKSGIDLYRDSQREDGMIWDNCYRREGSPNHWDQRFAAGGFIRPFPDDTFEFKRIPVENDVEYLFVEGLYFTWKATGDDGWMADSLPAAIRAMEYSRTSPYRWSEKFGLLKRGYTIDTWDFQSRPDCLVADDSMRVDPEITQFGIMFGDNTGYFMACRYLAEMLAYSGRVLEASRYAHLGDEIKARLDALCWNGRFYRHHVRENPDWHPDLGVDEAAQLSLSNAYSLNRGLTAEQCRGIIESYLAIKADLPPGSPGEWYTIYPPFGQGFGRHGDKWQYMNGGVIAIVAGELARGAFEQGYEGYGADILQRMVDLGKRHGGRFQCAYTGSIEPEPERHFHPVDLSGFANIDTNGEGAPGVPGWTGEGANDLHEMPGGPQTLAGVPFEVPDPGANGRRGAIGLSARPGYAVQVEIPVNATASSLYFLHTLSQAPSGVGGTITLHYEGGESHSEYVTEGRNVTGWWYPRCPENHGHGKMEVAWRGKNEVCLEVGLVAYGLSNPFPERKITKVTLSASQDGAFWAVLGLTLCDAPVYFRPSPISYGIPNGWSAAAVVYALIEGLAGVVDRATAFETLALAPRWSAANVNRAAVTVCYPESGGYIAYEYVHDGEDHSITLRLTGSGSGGQCHLLLPPGAGDAVAISWEGEALAFSRSETRTSRYVDFPLTSLRPGTIAVRYAPH